MADYNNNSRRPLLAEKRLLALAALEVVRRHDVLRMTELNSHVLELTSELAIVRNERDASRAEMVRRGYIMADESLVTSTVFGIGIAERLWRQYQNIQSGERTNLHPVDDQEFAAGIENGHPADEIFALAMAVQQITTLMTEVISHIDELNDELADVTSERDQMRYYLNECGWGRFRLIPREWWSARQARERG